MTYRDLADALSRGKGRERSFRCHIHGDSRASASVNVVKGLWVCYACGAGGKVGDIVEISDDFEFAKVMLEVLDAPVAPTYPEPWLDLFHQPGRAHPYWIERGFSVEAVDFFRLGYDAVRSAPCYPMRDPAGGLLGVVYRQLDRLPKYLYPSSVDKSSLLFGYGLVEPYETSIVLTEGALDAVACWDVGYPSWALYGLHLSEAQIQLLHRAGVRRVVLGLDNDAAARMAAQGWTSETGRVYRGIQDTLGAEGFQVESLDWSGIQAKDLPECNRDTRKSLLKVVAP